jgi:hypothetical protein
MIDLGYGDRLIAADEIERLRKTLEGLVAYLGGQAYRNYEDESELLTAGRAALRESHEQDTERHRCTASRPDDLFWLWR